MCEIFGFSGNENIRLNTYLEAFYGHSEEHPHGWGLAYQDKEDFVIQKEGKKALDSEYLKEALQEPIRGSMALAHIRYATVGNIEYENSHPFTEMDNWGRQWTLIHNGTLFKGDAVSSYQKVQQGATDSERFLLSIVDLMNQSARNLGMRILALCAYVNQIVPGNKLNFMLYDEEALYVHTNYKDSLYRKKVKSGYIFATTPLDDEVWEAVPLCSMQVYRRGALIHSSTAHDFVYKDNPEDLKMVYMDYSGL